MGLDQAIWLNTEATTTTILFFFVLEEVQGAEEERTEKESEKVERRCEWGIVWRKYDDTLGLLGLGNGFGFGFRFGLGFGLVWFGKGSWIHSLACFLALLHSTAEERKKQRVREVVNCTEYLCVCVSSMLLYVFSFRDWERKGGNWGKRGKRKWEVGSRPRVEGGEREDL